MDLTMDPSSKFWDRIADWYARRPIADQTAYERKLEITRGYFRPDMEVLEFGCGTGGTALLHAPFVGHIRAIDVSPRMIEIAETKQAEASAENVIYEVGAIESLDVPDEAYDAVLGMSILHLLEDKEAVIAKIHRILKPGGVFVSSTTCIGDSMPVFKYIAPIGRVLRLIPLVDVFGVDHLLDALEEAAFAIDHRWQPGKGKAVLLVATKAG